MISKSNYVSCGYNLGNNKYLELKNEIKESSVKFLSIKIFLAEHLKGLSSFTKMFLNYENKFSGIHWRQLFLDR